MKSFSEYLENIDESSKNNYSLSDIDILLAQIRNDWLNGLIKAVSTNNGYIMLSYKSGKANIAIDAKELFFSYVEKSGKTIEYSAAERSNKSINARIKDFYYEVHEKNNIVYKEKVAKLNR